MLGNGAGGFSGTPGSPIVVGLRPFSLVAADLNGDGAADLATANYDGNSLTLLTGNGNGTFQVPASSPVGLGGKPYGPSVADFNGDGKPDIVVPITDTQRAEVFLNSTPGFTKKPATISFYGSVGGAAPAAIPVSVASTTSGSTYSAAVNRSWLWANPTSAATGGVSTIALTAKPAALTAGTYSGIARYVAPGFFDATTGVKMRVAGRSGRLSPSAFPSVGAGPYSIATGDFNKDGKPDLATSNLGDNNVSVWLGTTLGTLTSAAGSPFAVAAGPISLVVGDFNADGKQDIATCKLLRQLVFR